MGLLVSTVEESPELFRSSSSTGVQPTQCGSSQGSQAGSGTQETSRNTLICFQSIFRLSLGISSLFC